LIKAPAARSEFCPGAPSVRLHQPCKSDPVCSRMVRTEQRALLYTIGSSDPNHICGHYRAIGVERKMASMDACLSSSKARPPGRFRSASPARRAGRSDLGKRLPPPGQGQTKTRRINLSKQMASILPIIVLTMFTLLLYAVRYPGVDHPTT